MQGVCGFLVFLPLFASRKINLCTPILRLFTSEHSAILLCLAELYIKPSCVVLVMPRAKRARNEVGAALILRFAPSLEVQSYMHSTGDIRLVQELLSHTSAPRSRRSVLLQLPTRAVFQLPYRSIATYRRSLESAHCDSLVSHCWVPTHIVSVSVFWIVI